MFLLNAEGCNNFCDQAGRLVEVKTRDNKETWSYDDNGNRTMRNGTNIAIFDAQDRILSQSGATYRHNLIGQRVEKNEQGQITSYRYDNLGNLREAKLPDSTNISYVIDPQDRRIGRKVNGNWTHKWIYQDGLNPIAELDENDRIRKAFIYADKGHVPAYMLTFDENGNEAKQYRIITDLLGSVRLVYDLSNGEEVQRIDYDVWGNITNDTNPDFQPFAFAGGLYDQQTKLTRFGARDYDAETGRWTAKDPILFNGGDTNLYGYVLNDPVNGFDPSGLEECRERKVKEWLKISEGWKLTGFKGKPSRGEQIIADVLTTLSGSFSTYQAIPVYQYIGLERLFDLDLLECWDECNPNEIERSIINADPLEYRETQYVNSGTQYGSPVWMTGFETAPTMHDRWFNRSWFGPAPINY